MNEVIDHLTQKDTRVVTIWGSAMFGKTSVAIQLGHRLESNGIPTIFASLKSVATAKSFVSKYLDLFEIKMQERPNNIQSREHLCSHFSKMSDRCVLIFDNVDDLLSSDGSIKSEFLDTIATLTQSNPKLRIVCTSRENMSYVANKVPAYSLKLHGLETSDSVKLMQELLSDKASQKECRQLAELFLNVPLALMLASSLICEDNVAPAVLIKHVEDNPNDILDVTDKEDNPDDMRLHILIEYSFTKLSPKYQWMFTCLPVFSGSFNVKTAASVLDISIIAVQKNMGVLQRKSFIESDSITQTYSLHDFMKAFLQDKVKGKESDQYTPHVNQAWSHFYDYYLSIVESINEKFLSGKALFAIKEFQRNNENITSCLKEAIKSNEKHERAENILLELDFFARYSLLV